MRAEGCPENAQVSILLCADQRMRSLNRLWRGVDAPTDVLAFAQAEGREKAFSLTRQQPGSPVLLGDVVISVQTAAGQAKSLGTTLAEELQFLVAHGILHLLGWSDITPTRRRCMLARQKRILKGK